jgi:hypothetical protein
VSPRGSLQQPLQALVDGVLWLSLEELGQQAELKRSTQQILECRPELLSAVLTMLFGRLPTLTTEELMVFAGIPTDQLLHTRAAQGLLDRGRQEGEAQGEARSRALGEATVTLRLLNRICGPLSEATTAEIQALPLEQLEALAVDPVFSEGVALLDFSASLIESTKARPSTGVRREQRGSRSHPLLEGEKT